MTPFQRVLVVNPTEQPDVDLLRYAGMLGASAERPELTIATPAGELAMRYLAPWSRCALASHPQTELSFRVMLEPHLDLLFDMAGESQSDLIVARHPRHLKHSKALLYQLLFDAPCAVCLVPDRVRPTLKRPMVRLDLTAKGKGLLSRAASFSRALGCDELLVLHTYFREGFDSQPESLAKLREERTLELYRLLARVPVTGLSCTPLLLESPNPTAAILRVSAEREADLLVIDPDADKTPLWQWNRREAGDLAQATQIPILATRIAPRNGLLATLREQVFCAMEPTFN